MWVIAFGVFLAVHGLIHLGYVSPAPADPKYPFDLGKSWLISGVGFDASPVRALGVALTIVTVVGFALTGLATAGLIVPPNWWRTLTLVSAAASLVLLVLFWHNWLVMGVVIDIALVVALAWLNWQPFSMVGT